MSVAEELREAVINGLADAAEAKAQAGLEQGLAPLELVNGSLVAAMNEVARLWREGEYFLPDVIMSAEAFKAAMAVLEPKLSASESQPLGKVIIGVVEGDMHDLGKNIVVALLRANGFEVVDLGVDIPVATFIEQVRQNRPQILGLGAYMSTTMLAMGEVVEQLRKQGLRDEVKVMVGGVPVNQDFADEIGADAWGADALDAVAKAKALLGVK